MRQLQTACRAIDSLSPLAFQWLLGFTSATNNAHWMLFRGNKLLFGLVNLLLENLFHVSSFLFMFLEWMLCALSEWVDDLCPLFPIRNRCRWSSFIKTWFVVRVKLSLEITCKTVNNNSQENLIAITLTRIYCDIKGARWMLYFCWYKCCRKRRLDKIQMKENYANLTSGRGNWL